MIEFIKGEISDLTPTSVVIETMGVGYFLNISVNTYSQLQGSERARLYVEEVIREDAYTLYGFVKGEERDAFRKLVSVSGVGAATARIILSSMTVSELEMAIISENVNAFKNVKGIGLKTAQRIIVELKDKVSRQGLAAAQGALPLSMPDNTNRVEALAALQMLGFAPAASTKAVNAILKEQPALPVEQIIKAALKML